MSELVRTQVSQRARRSTDISPVDDLTSLKIGAAQEGMTAKIIIPGEAPSLAVRDKKQTLSPILVGDIEPVLAPHGFERRPLQQPFAVPQKSLPTGRRNGVIGNNGELPGAERECKQRVRPSDQGDKHQRNDRHGRGGPQECSFDHLQHYGLHHDANYCAEMVGLSLNSAAAAKFQPGSFSPFRPYPRHVRYATASHRHSGHFRSAEECHEQT